MAYRREAHGGHADVMHPRNGKSHNHAASQPLDTALLLSAYHVKRDGGAKNGGQKRYENGRPMVGHSDWQTKRQHSSEMHRPNSKPHRSGSPGNPYRADPTARSGHTCAEIKRPIGRGDGNENGKSDEAVVVHPYKRSPGLAHWALLLMLHKGVQRSLTAAEI